MSRIEQGGSRTSVNHAPTMTPFGKRLDLRTRTVPLPDMRPGKAPVSDNRFPDLSADHGPLWIPLRHR